MTIEYKNIDKLILDPNNSRFAELYSGSAKEDDLIEYLLYTEAAEEIAKNISDKKQFYPDQALWVVPYKGKFLVKDGNRRCAAAKALRFPRKYGLDALTTMKINKLPVLVYMDEKKLERRIQEQHTHSLFREWERIAKALKAFEMHHTGSSEEAIREIDSNPPQLIKLASFYYTAVEIAGENLKRLLRRGKGSTGGKAIIFERLFRYSKQCGYKFQNKPSYQIEVFDQVKFEEYINAIVEHLKDNPTTSHKTIDEKGASFLWELERYGFTPSIPPKREGTGDQQTTRTRRAGSVRSYPHLQRKQIPPKLRNLIHECYNLDNSNFANAKIALSRVVFEAVLKYVVEETSYNGKKLRAYGYFGLAFYQKNGNPRPYTNFSILKSKFTELIKDRELRKAFEQFDLERLNQIIHNYHTGASSSDARTVSENLIPLVGFLLQDIGDLITSLDTTKLI